MTLTETIRVINLIEALISTILMGTITWRASRTVLYDFTGRPVRVGFSQHLSRIGFTLALGYLAYGSWYSLSIHRPGTYLTAIQTGVTTVTLIGLPGWLRSTTRRPWIRNLVGRVRDDTKRRKDQL